MNEICTCGAQLPPDARFCHKCGKPQYDLIEPEPVTATPVPEVVVAPVVETPPGVGLRNPVAVRVASLAGALCALLIVIPLPPVVQLLWQMILLFAGGFLSVYLYNRRTKAAATLRAGAALGWMVGFFCFLIMLVLFTVSVVAMAAGDGLQASFREMIAMRGNAEVTQQLGAWLESPAGVASLLFLMLVTSFFMLTLLPAVGGALAAKVLEKD